MKELRIRDREIELSALLDDEDYERLRVYPWRAHRVIRSLTVYARGYLDGSHTLLHRAVMNAKRGQIIDHIDGNGLNNQRANLRFVTQRENMAAFRARKAFDQWEEYL